MTTYEQPSTRAPVQPPVEVLATDEDIWQVEQLMRAGVQPGNEDFARDTHLNELIPKPWGYEYRIFADHLSDFWQLCLKPAQQTSLHAHPRKDTYLLCLTGQGVMDSLARSFPVTPGTVIHIGKGAFHRTRNTAAQDLHLIEVELPRNKFDLVRLADAYNRAGTTYETGSEQLHTEHKRVSYLAGASMCTRSPCGSFTFRVRTGADLFYRGLPAAGFGIPIGVRATTQSHHLSILTSTVSVPDLEQQYLAVAS